MKNNNISPTSYLIVDTYQLCISRDRLIPVKDWLNLTKGRKLGEPILTEFKLECIICKFMTSGVYTSSFFTTIFVPFMSIGRIISTMVHTFVSQILIITQDCYGAISC